MKYMYSTHNDRCDGDRCGSRWGEVRRYPLPLGGGEAHLCHDCWIHENHYRWQMSIVGNEWDNAEVYEEE